MLPWSGFGGVMISDGPSGCRQARSICLEVRSGLEEGRLMLMGLAEWEGE